MSHLLARLWPCVLAAIAVLGVAACRDREELPEPPPVPGASRAFAGTPLTLYASAADPGLHIDRRLAARFARDTGVQLTVLPRISNTTEALQNYTHLLEAHPADVDVLLLDTIWIGALADQLLDLRPGLGEAAKAHFPPMIRNNTVGGRLVALPLFTDVGVLYYRSDLLAKYGFIRPPATYDDLARMARAIQQGEVARDPYFTGYVWQGRPFEVLTCNALEWQANQGGGRILQPDQPRADVANDQAIAAFRRAAGWIGTISSPLVLTYDELDSALVFRGGHAAFLRGWGDMLLTLGADDSPVAGRFAIADLPRGAGVRRSAGVLGGWQIGISAASRHVPAATELVRYLASPEVQAYRAEVGAFLPTIPSVYEAPRVRAAQPLLVGFQSRFDQAIARPSRRAGTRYPALSGLYFNGVSAMLSGSDPRQVTRLMQQDIDQLTAPVAPEK